MSEIWAVLEYTGTTLHEQSSELLSQPIPTPVSAILLTSARLLGAAVGATRVATDLGWVEHARQIGSTGKTVRPKLYIACGISGAAQHTSGMSAAQTVIAINPDRSAPIFALADLGLLGDANQILPLAAKILEKLDKDET